MASKTDRYVYVLRRTSDRKLFLGMSSLNPKDCEVGHRELGGGRYRVVTVDRFSTSKEARVAFTQAAKLKRVHQSTEWLNCDWYSDKPSPFVYKLEHIPTGKIYIGSRYAAGVKPSSLWSSYFTSSAYVKELGVDNFRVVEVRACKNARDREAKILKAAYTQLGREQFLAVFVNRNIAPGIILDESSIAKMRVSLKGNGKGIPKSPEQRKKIGDSQRGRKLSDQQRAFLSRLHTGKTLSEAHKKALVAGATNFERTPEYRANLSAALTGRVRSQSHCDAISRAKKGKPSPMKGKQFSEEARANMRRAQQNSTYVISEETRQKMRESHRIRHERRKAEKEEATR
jgi:hypothetical protein